MCIYYKDKEHLTYSSEEHIIPAAIGGKQKLPKGFVCDQFNTKISAIEQQVFRDSLISTARIFVGPGKRGSLSLSKATASTVHLISSPSDPDLFALGYTKLGKTYEIPHLKANTSTGACTFSVDKTDLNRVVEILNEFKEKCINENGLKIKVMEFSELPESVRLIGIKDGIEENFNCFVAKRKATKVQITVKFIAGIGRNININDKEQVSTSYKPKVHQLAIHNDDHLRVYGKLAFNFLAMAKGKDFVCHTRFDPLRDWICNGGRFEDVKMSGKKILLSYLKLNCRSMDTLFI